jgi:hypothetical protein
MSKWTVFAYVPDLYGHVNYGIEKDNFMSGQVWRNKETAELIAAAWNGDDKQLASISDAHLQQQKQHAEMKALLEEIVRSWETARDSFDADAVIVQASKSVELKAKALLAGMRN